MKFRLLDADAKKAIHEGIAPAKVSPEAMTWGRRVFVLSGREESKDGRTILYREVEPFRIGAFGR